MLYEDYAAKSHEGVESARILFQSGCYNSCISRCYYAMFQMAIAALSKRGIKPPVEGRYGRSWVQAAIATEFVHRRKLLPGQMASYLSDVLKLRREADYEASRVGKKVAERTLTKMTEFIERLEELLG